MTVSMLDYNHGYLKRFRHGPTCWWCTKAVIVPHARCCYCNQPWNPGFSVSRRDVNRFSPAQYVRIFTVGAMVW